jgi:hypothetical protein
MEVIWESQRELACLPIKSGGVGLPLAFVLAWPIYVTSRVQSQDLQSKMATAAPFDFDSLLPIFAAHPLLQHVQNDDYDLDTSKPQHAFSDLVYAGIRRKLRTEGSPHMKALLEANSVTWSGSWLLFRMLVLL